nr:protein FAR1-RELATED SEQUENCE 5-like [Lolium perenne]
MDNAGSTSRAISADRACTEITLPQASSAQTPPDAQNDGNEGNAEVVSTPQAPRSDMRFDTLEDAQRHYLAFARRRGFGIRYNYRKKSEVTGEYIRAAMVCHKAGHQAKVKEDTQKPKPVVPERMKCSNIRTDYPARMVLKVRDGTWLVTEFCDDHNHPRIKKW